VGENKASADLAPPPKKTIPGINFEQEPLWTTSVFGVAGRERGKRLCEN
jgi:hypothetical protein